MRGLSTDPFAKQQVPRLKDANERSEREGVFKDELDLNPPDFGKI